MTKLNSMSVQSAFSHVRFWIFDLDNTLYSPHLNLWQQIDARIKAFISERLNIDGNTAFKMQKDFYRKYGTSLRGLMIEHGFSSDDFLQYVHDIDHSPLQANPALGAAIAALPGKSYIFTSGTHSHVAAVTRRLGIEAHFAGVFDIVDAQLLPKPHHETYELFCRNHGVDPQRAAFFEDLAKNLEAPDKLGMRTVLVVPDSTEGLLREEWELAGRDDSHVHHVTDDLVRFLNLLAA